MSTIIGPTGLTAVFGMGTGVTPPVSSPDMPAAGLFTPSRACLLTFDADGWDLCFDLIEFWFLARLRLKWGRLGEYGLWGLRTCLVRVLLVLYS